MSKQGASPGLPGDSKEAAGASGNGGNGGGSGDGGRGAAGAGAGLVQQPSAPLHPSWAVDVPHQVARVFCGRNARHAWARFAGRLPLTPAAATAASYSATARVPAFVRQPLRREAAGGGEASKGGQADIPLFEAPKNVSELLKSALRDRDLSRHPYLRQMALVFAEIPEIDAFCGDEAVARLGESLFQEMRDASDCWKEQQAQFGLALKELKPQLALEAAAQELAAEHEASREASIELIAQFPFLAAAHAVLSQLCCVSGGKARCTDMMRKFAQRTSNQLEDHIVHGADAQKPALEKLKAISDAVVKNPPAFVEPPPRSAPAPTPPPPPATTSEEPLPGSALDLEPVPDLNDVRYNFNTMLDVAIWGTDVPAWVKNASRDPYDGKTDATGRDEGRRRMLSNTIELLERINDRDDAERVRGTKLAFVQIVPHGKRTKLRVFLPRRVR